MKYMTNSVLNTLVEKEMATHCSIRAWRILGRRSMVGYSPWGREESDTTERLKSVLKELCVGKFGGITL